MHVTRRPQLHYSLADQLTQLIIDAKLRPGEFLPTEGELSVRFGVSRGVVREATKILQAKGLVEVRRGKGVAVCAAGSQAASDALVLLLRRHGAQLTQLWQVRMIIETEVAAMAAEKATEADLRVMAETLVLMRRDDLPLDMYVEADLAFHMALVNATGNIVLSLMLDSLKALMRESRETTLRVGGVARALLGHDAIYAAVRARAPVRARRAMREHLLLAIGDLEAVNQQVDGERVIATAPGDLLVTATDAVSR